VLDVDPVHVHQDVPDHLHRLLVPVPRLLEFPQERVARGALDGVGDAGQVRGHRGDEAVVETPSALVDDHVVGVAVGFRRVKKGKRRGEKERRKRLRRRRRKNINEERFLFCSPTPRLSSSLLSFSSLSLPVKLLEAQARRVVVVDLVDGVLEDLPGFLCFVEKREEVEFFFVFYRVFFVGPCLPFALCAFLSLSQNEKLTTVARVHRHRMLERLDLELVKERRRRARERGRGGE
jgi:hypothetical protein